MQCEENKRQGGLSIGQTARVRRRKCKTGGRGGGRERRVKEQGGVSSGGCCWRALQHRAAGEHELLHRPQPQGLHCSSEGEKKTSRKKDLLAGGDGATSPHRSREGREGEGKKETKRRSNQIQTEGKRTFFVVLGRTELPEIFTLYFWNPFNNLSPASRCFAEHDFALFLFKVFFFNIGLYFMFNEHFFFADVTLRWQF